MNKPRDELMNWLNDAYSMELTNLKTLEGHIRDAEEFPEIQTHLQQHLSETRQHAARIKSCLESIGGKVSRTKAGLGTLLGTLHGRSSSLFNDDIVKDVLSESATEHFEVACYKSLIAAAEQLGESGVAQVCRKNMEEDQSMANWIDEQVPQVTRRFMEAHMAGG